MGTWTTTEPTLPSGAQWLQGQTIAGSSNHWVISGTIYIASLGSNQFAVRMAMWNGNGPSGNYYKPSKWNLTCQGNTTTQFSVSKGRQTFYYIGEASAGTSITTSFNKGDSAIAQQKVVQTVPTGQEPKAIWTNSAPTLPQDSAYEQNKEFSGSSNHWAISGSATIARLDGNSFVIKLITTSKNGPSGKYYAPNDWKLSCDVGDNVGGWDTSFSMTKGASTYYYIGEASPGTTIKVNVNGAGGTGSAITTQTMTFTAPALLIVTLNISFDAQSGTSCTVITRDQGNTYGELPVSYRRGHKFLGWSTDTTSANIVSSSTTITQSADFTLYAIWKFIGALYVKINGAWQSIY